MRKKAIAAAIAAFMLFGSIGSASAASNFAPDPAGPMPSKSLSASFTSANIAVDGMQDAAYHTAEPSRIEHAKNATATASVTSATYGELRAVWDGPVLYLLVDVHDATKSRSASTDTGLQQNATNNPALRDSVVFGLDFWNDKVDKFQDDDGLFTISANGNLTYLLNAGVNNHSSVHAYPQNREYSNRIKSYAASETADGYRVELALQIEGAALANGTSFGVEVAISDSPAEGASRTGYVFWSHEDDAYAALSQDHSVDWGTVTLAGWDGRSPFKFSDWPLRDTIRWVESASLVKGVWTEASENELYAALAAAKGIVGATNQSMVNSVTKRLKDAIAALRWADARYPDPKDLPSLFTLPDPWTFFDGTKVKNADDWFGSGGRREEILDMAQFYEYGYKPAAPDRMTIKEVKTVPANPGTFYPGFGWFPAPSPAGFAITADIAYGTTAAPITFTLYPPTDAARQASGHEGPVPVVMSFGGYIGEYGDDGYAVLAIPTSVTTDDRNNPWGTRSGTFRTFFPYTRDGDTNEISNEMGAAWGASRAIDALELLAASGDAYGAGVGALVDPGKLAVTGHSINGKYAFVSAVFDDRIDVTIPSAAGATGPSPYRYVYIGHEYSWGKAAGTEMMGDTIRHNPGRTIELFRGFLTPGRFYERLDGAWGYGDRLPFDQHELIATLAPRAIVLHNTVNDYGDGAESDPLGLQAAKFVYDALGYDADDLVKFNVRPPAPGDGHSEDTPQRQRTAEYLDHYFYDKDMTAETADFLNDDPFDDEGARAENAYNRYYGGFETIAPWKDYAFASEPVNPPYTPSTPNTGSGSATENADGTTTVKGAGSTLTIPGTVLVAAASSPSKGSVIAELPGGSVTFTKGLVAELAKQAGGKDVTLSLTAAAPDDKGDVSVTLALAAADGQPIAIPANEPVTVSVPYMLADDRHADAVIAKKKNDGTILRGYYDPGTKRMIFKTVLPADMVIAYREVKFSDVPASSELYDAVQFLAARGITDGSGGGQFSPEVSLTRKEALVFLMRILNVAPDAAWTDNFADAGNDYAAGYLAAAKRLGISKGTNPAGTAFGGGRTVTVSEFYQFLYNALRSELPAKDPKAPALATYPDYADIPAWALEATDAFVGAGAALHENAITPRAIVDRGDAALLFYALLKN
ncbi:sugar-binding protein [Cohnella sp. JJ-181]|uniref:glucuronyl esterase domain-containing protein n=1 Tax=Cohnella rhizoplanae TaxID=2974897 RepID=UPI0022FF7E24|nr:sugar-binding protein [Cohnella sp. JJ-181]CAI6087081.1 hypothetical protein COHCIP112018_05320 [Cohnella sp. JJ-181]